MDAPSAPLHDRTPRGSAGTAAAGAAPAGAAAVSHVEVVFHPETASGVAAAAAAAALPAPPPHQRPPLSLPRASPRALPPYTSPAASPAAVSYSTPSALPLLPRTSPLGDPAADSPSVLVTVLPDTLLPTKQPPPAFNRTSPGQGSNDSSASIGGSSSGGGGTGMIRAHYTGSAAKRRSSAASIIQKHGAGFTSPSPSVVLGGEGVKDADRLAPLLLMEGLGEGGSEDGSGRRGTGGSILQGAGAGAGAADLVDRQASVFDQLERRDRRQARWQVAIAGLLDGVPYTLLSVIITLMVLYSDDFRVAVAPPSADPGFRGFSIFCLAFFALELLLSSLAKPRYFLGFYFFIDCVATASLLFDIPEFMALLTGQQPEELSGSTSAAAASSLAQASNESQSNLRAARIAQVIRVVRLIRIVKLYKIYAQNRHRIEGQPAALAELSQGDKQSRVGEKLTELTIRKVIIMVLALLFILPVFESGVGWYGTPPSLDDGGLQLLHYMYGAEGNSSAFQAALERYMDETPWRLGTRTTSRLLRIFVHNHTLFESVDPEDRRDAEITSALVKSDECEVGPWGECRVSAVFFDTKWYNQVQALLNMGRTSFIILTLVTAALLFMRDADRLVLQPLERMVKKVRDVSENPLARLTMPAEKEGGAGGKRGGGRDSGKQQLETRILENSITKICSLLSVGFGEAGAEVIADNIRSGGDLNPMIPGRKVTAIFGFCDIRQFTDTTEVLQEDVMEFVNSIAKIVHMEVALHGGAANKNIGDAFLLVWKLPGLPAAPKRGSSAGAKSMGAAAARAAVASNTERSSVEVSALEQHRSEMSFIADAALASFVIIQAAIRRSAKLKQYCARSDLNSRIPNFAIKMGFGLHVGWAIEGAIGSEFKIDASYLSPHVNMASRLEAATKQFGTTILLSEDFVRLLSPRVRPLVRQIDCVMVKGSRRPLGLYTYDASSDGLDVWTSLSTSKTAKSPMCPPPPKPEATAHESYSLASFGDEFREHPDIIMTRAVDAEFLELFETGFQAYITGDWPAACKILEECRTFRRNRCGEVVVDGPSDTLLTFMQGHGYEAPEDWNGYRELTEK